MAIRPHVGLINRLLSTQAYKKLSKYWYARFTRMLADGQVLFINWAYEEDPPMALPLDASDQPNRAHINLYHRVATQADLSDKRVLEVSCGHGGGASYLVRTLGPASYTALDLNPAGIEFCRTTHKLAGLDFVQGDAEDLPFADESFDVVLNVEASHLYPRFPRFLAEVARVLRPGGHFLYCDLRSRARCAEWETNLANAPMRQLSRRVINTEVLRGLEKNSDRSQELINRHIPAFLHTLVREFVGVQGSRLHRSLQNGDISYAMYAFIKD